MILSNTLKDAIERIYAEKWDNKGSLKMITLVRGRESGERVDVSNSARGYCSSSEKTRVFTNKVEKMGLS